MWYEVRWTKVKVRRTLTHWLASAALSLSGRRQSATLLLTRRSVFQFHISVISNWQTRIILLDSDVWTCTAPPLYCCHQLVWITYSRLRPTSCRKVSFFAVQWKCLVRSNTDCLLSYESIIPAERDGRIDRWETTKVRQKVRRNKMGGRQSRRN